MNKPFVRTVLGDILPSQMGLTYSHEHIVIEESFPTLANPEFILNDTARISAELKELYQIGGRTVVDTMPAACGRNVLKLAEVSRASGINIIVPTGLHQEIYYPPNHWRYHLSVGELTDLFINDVNVANHYGGHGINGLGSHTGTIELVSGESYSFRARMQENGGGEGLRVFWRKPSESSGWNIYTDELSTSN